MVLSAVTTAVDRMADGSTTPTLERCRRFTTRQRFRYRTWHHCGREYAAPIDPFRVHWLVPGAITHALTEEDRLALADGRPDGIQSVDGGDWDRQTVPFTETPLYEALRARFVDGTPWEETGYAEALERTNRVRREGGHDPRHELADDTDRNVRYAYLDELYDRIATEGYRSAAELRGGESGASAGTGSEIGIRNRTEVGSPVPPAKREIRVAVGRDGRFILESGHHRLAIARLLGLESIPVHVLVRHEQWQARRDRIVLTGTDDGDHPDLEGLTPGRLSLD
ncbi:hypothetical protein OB955_04095 [Halobacteria archaeon AArc-m2/3/4]|uniref:ParB-like nuclease domain-containing protein n=1 Tax=Natronoglomus mannanivorans TaxID=2979990 RepID=A0ABT2QAI1_9EURY|nr:hypothetical protein [Halobacteria archaeon AArc-m2/3/4]